MFLLIGSPIDGAALHHIDAAGRRNEDEVVTRWGYRNATLSATYAPMDCATMALGAATIPATYSAKSS